MYASTARMRAAWKHVPQGRFFGQNLAECKAAAVSAVAGSAHPHRLDLRRPCLRKGLEAAGRNRLITTKDILGMMAKFFDESWGARVALRGARKLAHASSSLRNFTQGFRPGLSWAAPSGAGLELVGTHLPYSIQLRAGRGWRSAIELICSSRAAWLLKSNPSMRFVQYIMHKLITYLKLSGKSVGLLINFNVVHLKNGIKRFVNGTDWK
jgi:hypothetical protein